MEFNVTGEGNNDYWNATKKLSDSENTEDWDDCQKHYHQTKYLGGSYLTRRRILNKRRWLHKIFKAFSKSNIWGITAKDSESPYQN